MHPINTILQTTMSELKEMVDVNTIVGDAFVTPSGETIIPISKLSFGFVTGGAEYQEKRPKGTGEENYPFAGGTASGISINPVAFLVTGQDNVRLMTASQRNCIDKIIEYGPQIISEIKSALGKEDGTKE